MTRVPRRFSFYHRNSTYATHAAQEEIAFCVPGWVHVLASLDGRQFSRVAQYSRWDAGAKQRFSVPANEGTPWIHTFHFPQLNVQARYVGLSFYGTGLVVTDELWVNAAPDPVAVRPPDTTRRQAFSVDEPQVYFHKPVVWFSTNVSTPNPVGLICPPDATAMPLRVALDLPPGMTLSKGTLGGAAAPTHGTAHTDNDGQPWTRYVFEANAKASAKTWGRVFLTGDWPHGKTGTIRCMVTGENGVATVVIQEVMAVDIPPVTPPKRLCTGLGWWSLGATKAWPDAVAAMRHLGFNTMPLFARWLDKDTLDADLAFLKSCRESGFTIMNIDSPFHHMLAKNKGRDELFAQFEDGSTGKRLCPSYRGPLYEAEIQRVAHESALVGAGILSCDIELWNWRRPTDCEKCTRCRMNAEKETVDDWKAWRLEKGREIWTDLAAAVQKAVRSAHEKDPTKPSVVDMGGYDFRPGHHYQHFWPFDRLYPTYMTNAQPSTYTPLEPYHIALIGDNVRKDRQKLPKSDVMPWLTPGDAGTFPGDAFRLALLECFANGSRGLHFWSGRVWDTETLAAYAEAIRIVTPVQDVIVDGDLTENVQTSPPVRVSGMALGTTRFLLVADYRATTPRTVEIRMPLKEPARAIDLETNRTIAEVAPQTPVFSVRLGPRKAIPIRVESRR